MINPGVIRLASKKIGGLEAVIEDNLGESIHFHYGKFRFDLTLKEFYEITDIFVSVAKELLGDLSEEIFEYDPIFLNYISDKLIDLERIENDTIELKELVVYGRVSKKDMGWTKLPGSIMYLALTGKVEDYVGFEQDNPVFVGNLERLKNVDTIIKNNIDDIGNIVLLNHGSLVLDGQHRASAILSNYGNRLINVKRFVFKKYDIEYKLHSPAYYQLRRLKQSIRKLLLRIF